MAHTPTPPCPSCGGRPWSCDDTSWEDHHKDGGKHWHCPDCGHTWVKNSTKSNIEKIFDEHYRAAMGDRPAVKSLTRRYPTHEETIKLIPKKVTIYYQGEFGGSPRGMEATAYNWAVAPYAQYDKAMHVYFIPKGKRNIREFVDASHYGTTTLILAGWGHPKSAGETMTAPTKTSSGMITMQSRYLMHDPRYQSEAKNFMDNYIAASKAEIIADFRKNESRK